ncbi:MAG: saccharopine dehydrogenase NADP-binding domain-containing protein [Candidatus Bathyarchaeota archaeon]|nr:saccharopine dehydrogenase NADP-binding domain-containing protein [Candidatus Bathyarchaeota archaeon]
MKVLVLGVGKMGYGLLKDLDAQPDVSEIVAADVDLERAKYQAERVGGEKISVRRADVMDRESTVKLMRQEFDVVASGLPRPFCDPAAAAAIEAGVGYADVAASFSTIFNLDAAARDAGVTVVPHIGLDIGIDRVLCGVGARKLDRTEGFHVWCGGFPQRGTPGYENPLRYKISWYWPYAVSTNIGVSRVLKDGKIVEVPNLSDPEETRFPEPIGRCEAFTTGGLLDIVEHLGLEGVKDAWAKTVRWPGHCETWRKLIDLHLLDREPLNVKIVKVSPLDVFVALGEKTLQYESGEGDAICQRVEVVGEKDGRSAAYIYEFIDLADLENDISAMARTTAFPCSIVAQMIARGEFDMAGVVHPVKIGYEERLSERFFEELSERRINITEYYRSPFN